MPDSIGRDRVRRLVDEQAAVVAEVLERMRHPWVDGVLVTRSDGTLIGIVERSTAEQSLDKG
ncbi:MAG: hypothetical protein M3N52_10375 [Actinomycetota bacterium]|nr:hypothetical protein [Actinomycetota bacterium]